MAIPVSVVCDRGTLSPLDLTPRIAEGSLNWSSVVPGGFASCSFQLDGDFRQTLKSIPYLSTIRLVGDSGSILWEGQVEDLSPTLSDTTVGLKVTAMGYQNVLKETSVRAVWSKRDMAWDTARLPPGTSFGNTGGTWTISDSLQIQTGTWDATNLSKSGVQITVNTGGGALGIAGGGFAEYLIPTGLTILEWLCFFDGNGPDTGSNKFEAVWEALEAGLWVAKQSSTLTNAGNAQTVALSSPTALRVGAVNGSGASYTPASNDYIGFYDMRLLGVLSAEDVADSWAAGDVITFGGFHGDTLIRSLLSSYVTELGQGVIEAGNDFTIDHLDVSVRRAAADILNEIAGYYSREWAVWENALLDWRTPNLAQHQWIVPIAQLTGLSLDASVVNSKGGVYLLYTDAASGVTAEAGAAATDRRNPYVLTNRSKHYIADGGTMTSNTAQQLATVILNDLGFGPVPAAGMITLPGETIVQHAQGNAKKAWEIRAGDNITIPELPLADVFTQDGRGECLFHIVSAEAETSKGEVTLTLDSYGSKRSDVLMARLAAVTQLLGG